MQRGRLTSEPAGLPWTRGDWAIAESKDGGTADKTEEQRVSVGPGQYEKSERVSGNTNKESAL